MTHVTKYEDIPPRYRKSESLVIPDNYATRYPDSISLAWIAGHEEVVQKKMNAPTKVSDSTIALGPPASQSQSNLGLREVEASESQLPAVSIDPSSSATILQERIPIEAVMPRDSREVTPVRQESEKEKDRELPLPVAYSTPAMQRIIDSVVDMNMSRSTPSSSRANSPIPRHFHKSASLSRPSTRPSSPSGGPSGWVALTARHSHRRFDIRPWGPRHLEYDYHKAYKEFQSAAYYALGQFGYAPTRGSSRGALPNALPSMADLRKVPYFQKACQQLDKADRALEEALASDQTWDNTPVPEEYFQYSLEDLSPEDMRRERPDNTTGLANDRKRSSVALEEEAITRQQLDVNDYPGKLIQSDIINETSNLTRETEASQSSKTSFVEDVSASAASTKTSNTTLEENSIRSKLRKKRGFDEVSALTTEPSPAPTRPASPVGDGVVQSTSTPSVRATGFASAHHRGRGRGRGNRRGRGRGKGRTRASSSKKI